MSAKTAVTEIVLNEARREELYLKCQDAMNEHHEGQPSEQTPALVYEAMDVLALLTANIFVNLSKLDPDAGRAVRRYFRDRFKIFVDELQNVKPKPEIILPGDKRH